MKNCKVSIFLFMALMIMGGIFSGTAIASDYQGYPTVALSVNGSTIQSDVPPIIIAGRTMVPLRLIAATLGATVSYNQQYNCVVITTGSNQSSAPAGKISGEYNGLPEVGVLVNGQALTGDVPPVILNGRTLVPIRMVADALGCSVNYSNGAVTVTAPGSVSTSSGSSNVDSMLSAASQNDTNAPISSMTGEENTAKSLDSTVNSTITYNDGTANS